MDNRYQPTQGTATFGPLLPIALLATFAVSPEAAWLLKSYRKLEDLNVTHEIPAVREVYGHHWEQELSFPVNNSGANVGYLSDREINDILYSFAGNLLRDMHESPEQFDKVFAENFWDILA